MSTPDSLPVRITGTVSILRTFLTFTSLILCSTGTSFAQSDPVFDAQGFEQNRAYFSQLPFEHIDTLSGGLILTFTDLVLPGNAGRELRFERTYNSKGPTGAPWSFGIAGVPMSVIHPAGPSVYPPAVGDTSEMPVLVTADGEYSTPQPLRRHRDQPGLAALRALRVSP
jgi:hypothetical protein